MKILLSCILSLIKSKTSCVFLNSIIWLFLVEFERLPPVNSRLLSLILSPLITRPVLLFLPDVVILHEMSDCYERGAVSDLTSRIVLCSRHNGMNPRWPLESMVELVFEGSGTRRLEAPHQRSPKNGGNAHVHGRQTPLFLHCSGPFCPLPPSLVWGYRPWIRGWSPGGSAPVLFLQWSSYGADSVLLEAASSSKRERWMRRWADRRVSDRLIDELTQRPLEPRVKLPGP